MYDTQAIAARIKSCAKSQKIAMKTLLNDCDMNINAISEFSKGKQMSCINLARIADYLGCSVDYLLGRTVSPSELSPEALELASRWDYGDFQYNIAIFRCFYVLCKKGGFFVYESP